MFPLADSRGRVLGFGARQMGEGRGPKYLNTSENALYHKGRQLFGIDVARKEAMKSARFTEISEDSAGLGWYTGCPKLSTRG